MPLFKQKKYDTSEIYGPTFTFKYLKLCAVLTVVGATICYCADNSGPATQMYTSHLSEGERSFAELFQRYNSPKPVEMAIAVCKTQRPALMAAIAVRESGGDPSAIGDNGESKGAFQVQEKHWGFVPSTASEQALQAERILEELLRDSNPRGNLRQALARYNGGTRPPTVSYRYADRVIKTKKEISYVR